LSLNYPSEWKFRGVGFGIPPAAIEAVTKLLVDVADGSKSALEDFKGFFGGMGGSSSYDYAIVDLEDFLARESDNAAKFVDALWKCVEYADKSSLKTPSPDYVSEILVQHGVPLRIQPPDLLLAHSDSDLVDARMASDFEATTGAFAGYRLGDPIGQGGYGVVFKATRTTTVGEFEYAIKVLDPSPFIKNYEKAIARFNREVAALSKLQHRAIVQYFEAGVTSAKKPYLVMPLVDGLNLKAASEKMAMRDILSTFAEILRGLEYAHANGVVHRDLKPTNIIVRYSDWQPIILDFGSAYMLDDLDKATLTSDVVGTAGYIPSEVMANPKLRSPLQDIYACGVMLYEAFAGHRPDPLDYRPLEGIRSELSPVDPIIRDAIKRASDRTKSAGTFADQLAGAV